MFRKEIVAIPATVLFEEMLKQLHLPKPAYKTHVAPEGKLQATVVFFPATCSFNLSYNSIQLSGHPMNNVDDANNDAAKQAINYMEKTHGKILKDYNYEELQKKNEVKDRHIDELSAVHRKYRNIIREKDEQIINLTKYWDDCIMHVSNINDKIDNIAQASYTPAECQLEKDINSTLYEIQQGTKDLHQLTFRSTDLLRKVGKYPYDEELDTSEGDRLSARSLPRSPPDNMKPSPEYDFSYDSDGLCAVDFLYL